MPVLAYTSETVILSKNTGVEEEEKEIPYEYILT